MCVSEINFVGKRHPETVHNLSPYGVKACISRERCSLCDIIEIILTRERGIGYH